MSNGKIEDEASSINFWLRWPEPGLLHSLKGLLDIYVQSKFFRRNSPKEAEEEAETVLEVRVPDSSP